MGGFGEVRRRIFMDRIWNGVKRFCKWYAIVCGCGWLVIWALASYEAGRMIGLDELGVIPPASEWMGILRAALQ